MNTNPVLTDAEVADICAPLRRGSAQVRYFRDHFGLPVRVKPNGRPVVSRAAFERALSGVALGGVNVRLEGATPDAEAFLALLARRKR